MSLNSSSQQLKLSDTHFLIYFLHYIFLQQWDIIYLFLNAKIVSTSPTSYLLQDFLLTPRKLPGWTKGWQLPEVGDQEWQGLPRGPSGQGLAARAHPTTPSQEQGSWGAPGHPSAGYQACPWGQAKARLELEHMGGPSSAGPMARQGRAVGSRRQALLRHRLGRGWWPWGANVGFWDVDRVRGGLRVAEQGLYVLAASSRLWQKLCLQVFSLFCKLFQSQYIAFSFINYQNFLPCVKAAFPFFMELS